MDPSPNQQEKVFGKTFNYKLGILRCYFWFALVYLAKDKQRRKEIQQEQKELQQSPSKKEEEIDCPSNKPNWRE